MRTYSLQPEKKLSRRRKNIFALISITLITFVIYSNTFNASWHFDDEKFLSNKAFHLAELSWPEIKKVLKVKGQFDRPVATFSLVLNYYFGKDNVVGYHFINLSIHFIASIFLFLFLYHTLNLPSLRSYRKNAYAIALLSTILWTINPVHTQAVTYIIQRMAGMAGMFYIMAMYLYIRGRTTTQGYLKVIFYFLCTLAFILSLGSKENGILLPMSLLLFELLFFRKVSLLKKYDKTILFCLITVIGTLSIIFFYLYFIKGSNIFSFLDEYKYRVFSLKERLLTEPKVILFYIGLLLYPMPTRLCLNHDISISKSLLNPPETLLAILVIIGLIIAAFIFSKKWPVIAFCISFFFLNHMVESTIIPLEMVSEHRNYIPSMFFFIPMSVLLLKSISFFTDQRVMRNIIIGSIVLFLIGSGHSTYVRNFVWATEESLWLDCIDKYPNLWRPYHNLGKYYSDTHQKEKAIMMYNKALNKKVLNNRLDQSYFATYFNLGVEYLKMSLYEKAMHYFLKAETANPKYGPLHNNIGIVFLRQKRYKDAEARFKQALRYQPDLHKARVNLNSLPIQSLNTYHIKENHIDQ